MDRAHCSDLRLTLRRLESELVSPIRLANATTSDLLRIYRYFSREADLLRKRCSEIVVAAGDAMSRAPETTVRSRTDLLEQGEILERIEAELMAHGRCTNATMPQLLELHNRISEEQDRLLGHLEGGARGMR